LSSAIHSPCYLFGKKLFSHNGLAALNWNSYYLRSSVFICGSFVLAVIFWRGVTRKNCDGNADSDCEAIQFDEETSVLGPGKMGGCIMRPEKKPHPW
jgi:hypothetical protein